MLHSYMAMIDLVVDITMVTPPRHIWDVGIVNVPVNHKYSNNMIKVVDGVISVFVFRGEVETQTLRWLGSLIT